MTTLFRQAAATAANTPPDRNRVVDTLRVLSILVVVVGHWLMAAVQIDGGSVVVDHVLNSEAWARPLTWLLQVMPIFFFVGGYSNALSWRSARRRGEGYSVWLRTRLRRLTLPVVPLLLVWAVAGYLALQGGVDPDLLRMASAVAMGPTWFLAAYVVIVCLAPVALSLWERYGWWTVGCGLAAAALMDIVSIALGVAPAGYLNYIFVWGTVHQLGYAWVDGKTTLKPIQFGLAAAGFVATLALVWAGPYPVAMVGFDSGELTNSLPPRLTLAFLGVFQAGLALIFEKSIERFLERTRVWVLVVLVSAQIMTLYLWHLSAMIILIAGGLLTGGIGFSIEPFTGVWWITRPIWLLALAAVTIPLMLLFGRFERPRADRRPATPAWRPVMAAIMICAGLGSLAAVGVADTDGLNGLLITLPLAGLVFGGVVGASIGGRRRAT